MESYSETFGNSKVTFYGVVSTFPSVSFYYSFPAQYKPEVGDWIAICPVGWSNVVSDYLVKKTVKPDGLWNGIYGGDKWIGNMEFDLADWMQSSSKKYINDKTYQLVYVKSGDWVLGTSKPFSIYTSDMFCNFFGGETPSIFGYPATPSLIQTSYEQPEFSVDPLLEQQLQELIGGVYNIEQSFAGWYKNGSAFGTSPMSYHHGVESYFKNSFGDLYGSKFSPVESLINQVVMPHQVHKYWMTKVGEMEHMITEQFKIEQAQRRIDQTYILAQLKTYERYIYYMMKKEHEINEYMRNVKLAAKLAEFEQKCYEVVKTHSLVEQPEYYIQKYEQLLKEKIELEIVERTKYLPKLRQLVKECLEFKLKEIQSMEHQYYTRFYQLIKTKLGMWQTKFYQPIVAQYFGKLEPHSFMYEEKLDYELRQQLKTLIGQFYAEQVKEYYQLVKLNKQVGWLCGELSAKLYQFEWTYGAESYAQMKLAPKLKPIMFISSILYPYYPYLIDQPISKPFTFEETTKGFYYGGEYQPIKKLVELEQTLFDIRNALKYTVFSNYQDKYPGYEMWSPIEFYLQSGCHSIWKHLQMLERKLVFLKGVWVEKQLKSYLMQRITDYTSIPTFTTKYGDKIKYLKSMYGKHYQLPTYEAYWPAYSHYLFTTPESFFQHHEQFDKLWTMFNEFEFETVLPHEMSTYYSLPSTYEGTYSKEVDYPYFSGIAITGGKKYYGPKYSTYGYYSPKFDYYPSSYGGFFGNESFKSYKPYLSRSGVYTTSYAPLTSGKVFGGVLNPIETIITELEGQVGKYKTQKEFAYEYTTPLATSAFYTPVDSYFPSPASSFF